MYWVAMGKMHGKIAFHLPSKMVGVARSRLRSGTGNTRTWEYSLLLANGVRTPFFSEREFVRPTRDQVNGFLTEKAQIKAKAQAAAQAQAQAPAAAATQAPAAAPVLVPAPVQAAPSPAPAPRRAPTRSPSAPRTKPPGSPRAKSPGKSPKAG